MKIFKQVTREINQKIDRLVEINKTLDAIETPEIKALRKELDEIKKYFKLATKAEKHDIKIQGVNYDLVIERKTSLVNDTKKISLLLNGDIPKTEQIRPYFKTNKAS